MCQNELDLMNCFRHGEVLLLLILEKIQAQKEEERKIYEDSRNIVDSIPKMTNSDQPEAYLCHFEELLNEAGIPVQQWAKRLKPLLTRKALNAYTTDVPEDSKGE